MLRQKFKCLRMNDSRCLYTEMVLINKNTKHFCSSEKNNYRVIWSHKLSILCNICFFLGELISSIYTQYYFLYTIVQNMTRPGNAVVFYLLKNMFSFV